MPPKQRGHNTMGRDKLFRNAVEHVHVGVGHMVLGNFTLTLAAGSPQQSAASPHSAFFLELNELMLSHTSNDFKKFRWENLPLCESKALMLHHQKTIAQNLLTALLSKENNEGFYAFLRLSIAFARDVQEKFLLYFESFHKIVNSGVYDKSGQLIPDAVRLQLIFATQVAWLREVGKFLAASEHRTIVVGSIVPLFIHMMKDGKEYIRRLAAEAIASTCRQNKSLIALVVELVCFELTRPKASSPNEVANDDNDDGSEVDAEEEAVVGEVEGLHDESIDPVVDGLGYFVVDLLRGIKGTLNTNFEEVLQLLFFAFRLMKTPDSTLEKIGATANEEADNEDEGSGASSVGKVVRAFVHFHPLAEIRNVEEALASMASKAIPHALRILIAETKKHSHSGTALELKPHYRLFQSIRLILELAPDLATSDVMLDMMRTIVHAAQCATLNDSVECLGPLKHIVLMVQSSRFAELPSAKLSMFLASLLRIVAPLCVEGCIADDGIRAWVEKHLTSPFLAVAQNIIGMQNVTAEDFAPVLFAFSQDVMQKHRALCLHLERDCKAVRDTSDDDEEENPEVKQLAGAVGLTTFEPRLSKLVPAFLQSTFVWFLRSAESSPNLSERLITLCLLASEKTEHVTRSLLSLVLDGQPQLTSDMLAHCCGVLRSNHGVSVQSTEALRMSSSVVLCHMTLSLMPYLIRCAGDAKLPPAVTQDILLCVQEFMTALQASNSNDESDGHSLTLVAHACEVLMTAVGASLGSPTDTSSKKKKKSIKTIADHMPMDQARVYSARLEQLIERLAAMCLGTSNAVLAANQTLTRAIGYCFDALNQLIGDVQASRQSSAANSEAAIVPFLKRLVAFLSSSAQEALVELCMKALSSSSQSLRIRSLRLLKTLCFDDGTHINVRVKGCHAVDAAMFDSLISAETADPLSNSGSIDGARIALTKVSYEAGVGHIHDELQATILLRSCFGLLHIKFADVWPTAFKMITDLIRQESKRVADSKGADCTTPLWDIVTREARDIVFASGYSARPKSAKGRSNVDVPSISSPSQYKLEFSDLQHHQAGTLVSKMYALAAAQSQLSLMEFLQEGEVCDASIVATILSSPPHSTDAVTVSKTFLNGLADILKHSGNGITDQKVLLVETLLNEIVDVDQGTHPDGLTTLKGLEDRMILAMNALAVAPTSVPSNKQLGAVPVSERAALEKRNASLVQLFTSYLPHSNYKLQQCAVENLKRLKVSPFDQHADKLTPFCGSNMKDAFAFLSSFHVDTDVEESHRVEYIAAALVLVLPKLSMRVVKEKVRDQAVLGRRVMSFLQHVSADDLVRVLNNVMSRLLVFHGVADSAVETAYKKGTLPPLSLDENPLLRYDFIGTVCAPASLSKRTHIVRRFEQVMKQLVTAGKVMAQFVSTVGLRFAPWAFTCFGICVQAYRFSCRTQHPQEWRDAMTKATSSVSALATTLRKVLGGSIQALMDQFPVEISSSLQLCGSNGARVMESFVTELFANSKTLSSTASTSRGATGIASMFLKLLIVWVSHGEYLPMIAAFGDVVTRQIEEALAVATDSASHSVHKATPDTVFAALKCVSDILFKADEPIVLLPSAASPKSDARTTATVTLGETFVPSHIEVIFEALYNLVLHGSRTAEEDEQKATKNNARTTGKRVMGFTIRMWGEVIQTVALLADRIDVEGKKGSSKKSSIKVQEMLGQLLEIALKFVSNPICCADRQAVVTACTVVEALTEKIIVFHPAHHYRRVVQLFNMVTNPEARVALCRIYAKGSQKCGGTEDVKLQYAAVSRLLIGLNSFVKIDSDNDETNEEQQTASKRQSKKSVKPDEEGVDNEEEGDVSGEDEELTFDKYDFERRYHCFHSVMTFFNHNGNYGALQAATSRAAVTEKHHEESDVAPTGKKARIENRSTALPRATVRQERQYEGEEDVRIPVGKSRNLDVLDADALMAVAANLMFFLRDPERTIRSLAAQALFSLLRYTSSHQEQNYATITLEATIRPIVLSSLRQGVVAKDPAIRLAHMESFGGLAKHYPQQFPSFALLYSQNSERNFFINVGHAQHKCRLNALALLRKQAPQMNVRDLLRVFIPFLLVSAKDFAQGRRDGAGNATEGRAKGYAESVLLTMASLAVHMPWEGYYHVITLLLTNAKENESLRMTMLKGVVHVLSGFHFLDELEKDRSAGAREIEDSEEEEGDAKRSSWRSQRIISTLENDILPQLYRYITTDRKSDAPGGKGSSEVRQNDNTAEKVKHSTQSKPKENRTITQLPVAVAIVKIVRLFPEEKFQSHIDQLLHEVILKLRTKNDKHRESARKVLCSMMQEIGPEKMKFVVTKLKDNFVHGYQLHVLGYTVVTLLYSLYAPASPYALITRKQQKQIAKEAKRLNPDAKGVPVPVEDIKPEQRLKAKRNKRSGDESDESSSSSSDDDENDAIAEEVYGPKGLAAQPRFDEDRGLAALHDSMQLLMEIFMDDYLGEIGAQKEQIELMSTMMEVKRSRALQGFVFLATHCDATTAMKEFQHKIAWVLAPPTAVELLKKSGNAGAHIMGTNLKYVSGGDKNAFADAKFVNKVRFLALRVARALMTNKTLDLAVSLDSVHGMLAKHNAIREEKIKQFEAKEGTRRIRGNWATHIAVSKKSSKEQFEQNFAIAQRPERIDIDFNAPTVLLSSQSQQKQKLKVYRGRYAKEVGSAGKSFADEEPETAVVLDTLDEFCLKFLLSVLKRVLGIGKEKKFSKIPMKSSAAEADEEVPAGEASLNPNTDVEEVEGNEGFITQEAVDQALEEEEEALVAVGGGEEEDELDQFQAEQLKDDEKDRKTGKKKKRSGEGSLSSNFIHQHKRLLEQLVPVLVEALQGEGSDTVVSHCLDVLHALLALRPPLDAVQTCGKEIFDTIVLFFARGGIIKQRALRVTAAVVQHKKFQLADADAAKLVLLARTELLDHTEFLPNSLLLLLAVFSKHALVVEVYDIISVVTEVMMHMATSQVVRTRCVAVLAKFLTEYKLTREKLKSHLDLYVRNLQFPTSAGRIALMELLDSLIFRFPVEILKEEAQVLFVPLTAVLCRSEWRECKEKAAVVLGHLAVNAGVESIAPVMIEWFKNGNVAVRTSSAQVLGVVVSYVAADFGGDTRRLAKIFKWALPFVCQLVQADVAEVAASKRERKRREAEEEAPSKSHLTKKAKTEVESKGWQAIFFPLRCAEALIDISPLEFFPMLGAEFVSHLFMNLLEHVHPWIRSASMRIALKYVYQYVEPHSLYLSTEEPWGAATEVSKRPMASTMDLVCAMAPLYTEDGQTVADGVAPTMQQCELQLARCTKYMKRVLATIPDLDVGNEKYEANRAIEDSNRTNGVKVALFLAKAISQLTLCILKSAPQAEHILSQYQSIWTQIESLAKPCVQARSIDGYFVRTASLVQLIGGLISTLPVTTEETSSEFNAAVYALLRTITPQAMFDTVAPLVAMAMEASYISDMLAGQAHRVADTIRNELQRRAVDFAAAVATRSSLPAEGKALKKSRREGESSVSSGFSVEDVIVELTRMSEEKRQERRDAEVKKQAEKSFKRSRDENNSYGKGEKGKFTSKKTAPIKRGRD